MSIKKFIISTGDGELEESELDSSGQRTIGYDDVAQRVQLSKAYIVGDLYVSGSIIGTLTGSVSGSASGGGSSIPSTVKFTSCSGTVTVGDIVSVGLNGLTRCNNNFDLLSNAFGVVYSSGSGEIQVQTHGEIELRQVNGIVNTGSVLYAGIAGEASTYDNISSGCYITQIGYISGNGTNKLIIQPRVFGQKG